MSRPENSSFYQRHLKTWWAESVQISTDVTYRVWLSCWSCVNQWNYLMLCLVEVQTCCFALQSTWLHLQLKRCMQCCEVSIVHRHDGFTNLKYRSAKGVSWCQTRLELILNGLPVIHICWKYMATCSWWICRWFCKMLQFRQLSQWMDSSLSQTRRKIQRQTKEKVMEKCFIQTDYLIEEGHRVLDIEGIKYLRSSPKQPNNG